LIRRSTPHPSGIPSMSRLDSPFHSMTPASHLAATRALARGGSSCSR
jgi:hypothetical protein